MYICKLYLFWHNVLIWSLENCWFNFVLLIIRHAEDLAILLSLLWRVPLPMQLTCFWETFVTASWNKINYVGTIKHLAKHIIAFAAVSCWLKALGICAEGLWIRAEFLYNIRWQEEHPTHKLSLVHLHSELQARVLPLRGIINFYSPWNHKRTADFRGNRS